MNCLPFIYSERISKIYNIEQHINAITGSFESIQLDFEYRRRIVPTAYCRDLEIRNWILRLNVSPTKGSFPKTALLIADPHKYMKKCITNISSICYLIFYHCVKVRMQKVLIDFMDDVIPAKAAIKQFKEY